MAEQSDNWVRIESDRWATVRAAVETIIPRRDTHPTSRLHLPPSLRPQEARWHHGRSNFILRAVGRRSYYSARLTELSSLERSMELKVKKFLLVNSNVGRLAVHKRIISASEEELQRRSLLVDPEVEDGAEEVTVGPEEVVELEDELVSGVGRLTLARQEENGDE